MFDKFELAKEVGNFLGRFYEENGQFCIDNYGDIYCYDSCDRLLAENVETLVTYQHNTQNDLDSDYSGHWEKEIVFIYSEVIGKFPDGILPEQTESGLGWISLANFTSFASAPEATVHLGTYPSIVDAIFAQRDFIHKIHANNISDPLKIAEEAENQCKRAKGQMEERKIAPISRRGSLDQANSLLTDILSHPDGDRLFLLANIIYSLNEVSELLSTREQLILADRILDASQLSTVPLLTAERVDAVRTLLEYGISRNRFPELPRVSPEEMKQALLYCDMDTFTDLIEAVAVDNQKYFAPDEPLRIADALQFLTSSRAPEAELELRTQNTKIGYLYRDADNYKVWNECVISGVLTEEQQEVILDCLVEGEYFIPSEVGLPERKFDEYDEDVDHPWFELWDRSFSIVEAPATVSINAEELVTAFTHRKGHWLDPDFPPVQDPLKAPLSAQIEAAGAKVPAKDATALTQGKAHVPAH